MCIAIYKPAGVDLPDYKTLSACDKNNPDFNGYMVANGESVIIRKGFKGIRKLIQSINKMSKEMNREAKDLDMVLHFRIATSGLVKPQNAHPFPLSPSVKRLQQTSLSCETGMAHNGMFFGVEQNESLSDTQVMIRDVLCSYTFNELRGSSTMLKELFLGSKVVFLNKDGKALRFGEWINDGGRFYSNHTYLPYANYRAFPKKPRVKTRRFPTRFLEPDEDVFQWMKDDEIYRQCLGCGTWKQEDELMGGYCGKCSNVLLEHPPLILA